MIATALIVACDAPQYRLKYKSEPSDSAFVVKQIDKYFNPVFTDVQDAIVHKHLLSREYKEDSVMINLPEEVFVSVANVIVNKKMPLTQRRIVEEYLNNKTVYDNLNYSTLPTNKIDLSATDLGNRQSSKVSYSSRTDTINGKTKNVIIKTEEYYEE